MPTTTATVAAFQTALMECADAIEAQDWGTAYRKLAKAEAINAALELAVGVHGGASVARRNDLNKTAEMLTNARTSVAITARLSRFVRGRLNFDR